MLPPVLPNLIRDFAIDRFTDNWAALITSGIINTEYTTTRYLIIPLFCQETTIYCIYDTQLIKFAYLEVEYQGYVYKIHF